MPQDPGQVRAGNLAAERGLVTREQLDQALGELDARAAAGSHAGLGDLLVELGYLTRSQLEMLLEAVGARRGSSKEQIPGFELVSRLGEGGMGATYLARQVSMDRLVALKVLRKQLSRDEAFLARFRQEARLAGRLRHENIVRTYDVGEAGGYHFLIMEYVEGRNLLDMMPGFRGMEEKLALDITAQVARAMDFAEARGIIHRDIKPDNVLVTAGGVAKLCDFGLARQTDQDMRLTRAGMAMGTPQYISPEQAQGQRDTDVRADIYSLGATLYHLVTGQPPFQADSALSVITMHITEQLPWPRDINPEVSENCCLLIQKMMAKDRGDRHQTPAELIADIELVSAGRPPAGAAQPTSASSVAVRGAVPLRRRPRREPAGKRRARAAPPRREPRRAQARRRDFADTAATGSLAPVGSRRVLPMPLLAAACACVLGLTAWLLYFMLRSGDAQPPPRPTTSGPDSSPGQPRVQPPVVIERPPGPVNPPGDDAGDELRKRFERARDYWKQNRGDFAKTLTEFKDIESRASGLLAMELEDAVKEVEAARTRAVEEAVKSLEAAARKLADAGDFDGALAALAKPPPDLAELVKPKLEKAQVEMNARARARLDPLIAGVERLSKAGQPQKGLEQLARLAAIKYAPYAAKLAALKTRLESEKGDAGEIAAKRRLAESRKYLADALAEFDRLVLAAGYDRAVGLIRDKRKRAAKETLKPIAAELKAAERVARVLAGAAASREKALKRLKGKRVDLLLIDGSTLNGEVTRVLADGLKLKVRFKVGRGWAESPRTVRYAQLAPGQVAKLLPSFKPKSAEDQVAAALMFMAGGRNSEAEAALRAAGKHILAGRYLEKLAGIKAQAAEAAAQSAWQRDVAALEGRKSLTVAQAGKLLAALTAFSAAHAATDFAKSRRSEVARLRAMAEEILSESPGGTLARLRQIFGGKVVEFDPGTRRIELAYDFEDPAQFEDWWGGGKGKRLSTTLMTKSRAADSGAWGVAKFKAPIYATELEFHAECEPSTDFRICWFLQNTGFYPWGPGAVGSAGTAFAEHPKGRTGMHSAEKKGCDFRLKANQRYRMKVAVAGEEIKWSTGGRALLAVKFRPAGTRLGLGAWGAPGAICHFDNVRVVGKLDAAWLESALKLAGKPSPWRATWRKMGGRKLLLGHCAAAFDTSRGLYVATGGDCSVWAYNLRADKWFKLCDPVKGDGTSFPKKLGNPTAAYDSEADRLFCTWGGKPGTLSFDMRSRKWGVLSQDWSSRSPPTAYGGGTVIRVGLGVRDAKSFSSTFDPAKRKWTRLAIKAIPARTHGANTMTYDTKRKRFVLFSGCGLNDTRVYSPDGEWTELRPVFSPPARVWHSTCYDAANDLVVMHGGKPAHTDTWVFDAERNSWFELKTAESPSAHVGWLRYDPSNRCCIAWKGGHHNGKGGEVWALKIAPAGR
jgi:serine/threonine-protein kinase